MPYDECEISLHAMWASGSIRVWRRQSSCDLSVRSTDHAETVLVPPLGPVAIDDLESILLEYAEESTQPDAVPPPGPIDLPFRVFLGHGADDQWRVLRDELRDHHGFEIEAFERTPRAGRTIRQILEGMAEVASVAVLVLTGSDETASGHRRGRQNVVHEIGYFQGVLGWEQVIVVSEEGIEMFSNLDGTQQVRFPRGNIRAATGAVVANLRVRRDG